jgi:hypothetical protein
MRRATAVVALALVATGLHFGTAQADEKDPGQSSAATVGVRTGNASGGDDRGAFDYEVLPKGVVQDWIAVSNYRYQPITVRLFAKDATTTAGSPFAVQQSSETPHDVGAWVVLKKQRLTLPPRSEISVPFQLGVPYNATPGDHAGAIVVSLLAREPKPDGGSIIVDHRVGMRIHLRVPGALQPRLQIEGLKVDWNGEGDVLGRGDAVVSYTVRNTGNVRMNATSDLELGRVLGLPAVSSKLPAVDDVLPGGSVFVTRTVKNVFGTGPMKPTVTLHATPVDEALSDKVQDVHESTTLQAWPWLLAAIVVGLILLLLLGGWNQRRRTRSSRKEPVMDDSALAAEDEPGSVLVRLALVGAVLALVGVAQPAQAADGDRWQAALSKKDGVSGEPFDLLTSGGCPAPATNVVGFGYGIGFPKQGAVVVSNTDVGVSPEGPFRAPLVDSMTNLMTLQPNPKPLAGEYKFVLRCIEAEWPDRSYGEYVVAIKFDRPGPWKVLAPLTRTHGPSTGLVTHGENGEPPSEPPATTDEAGKADGDGTSGETAESPQQHSDQASKEAQSRAAELTDGADAAASGSGISWPLMVAGIGVLVAVGLLLLGKLPRLNNKDPK